MFGKTLEFGNYFLIKTQNAKVIKKKKRLIDLAMLKPITMKERFINEIKKINSN